MKKLYLTSGILVLTLYLHAQELVSIPYFPADSSAVNLVVDCSRGNQGLYNYANTSDVYVHVGLITSLSTSSSDWRYVPFTWGTANPAAQAGYLGNNKYQFTIQNIRSFFNVPAGEKILKIAILFRNGSGTLAQRNADGSDMFASVYDSSLAIRILQPPFQPTYNPIPEAIQKNIGDSLAVSFVTNHFSKLIISYDGVNVDSIPSDTLISGKIHITTPGTHWVAAHAIYGSVATSDSFSFYVAAAAQILPLPPGVTEGINYQAGDTSAILVLYSPNKNKIVVVGDFNNWTQQTAYQMNRTPDNNYYWIQLGGLTPGQEYAYQYVIDDTLTLADYNTEKVLDKNVDPQIPASTYPNLKPFPAQAAGTLAGIIQTGKPAYNWQVPNFKRPGKSTLMIYELLVRDYTAQGNWQALIDTLGYLKHLGVNAIEIMPFNNFEGSSSWGYNPNFYFAPDKTYGTETMLKQFIDACHGQGMAVIMDMVLNHSFGSSPMVQMYFNNSLNVPATNSPWFNQYPTHAFNVGYQFNHESPATRTFTQRVISYWLANYHIDGYRFDLAKGFTQNRTCDPMGNNCDVSAWGAYDTGRVAIWKGIYDSLQVTSPGSYCILEMFADNSEQTVEANYGMMLWGNMNANFNQATMGYSTPSPGGATWDLTGGIYSSLGWNKPGLVVYQESHDEERLMYNNEQYGNSTGIYHVRDTATGLHRNEMGAAFWALFPGPKMLWQFGELGYDYSINYCPNGTVDPSGTCRLDPKPIRWDYLQNSNRKKLHDVYQAMMQLRGNYPALDTGKVSYDLASAFKSLAVSATGISAVVMGNFDVSPNTGSVTFPVQGTWYNYFSGDSVVATGSSQSFILNAGEYRVYTTLKMQVDTSGSDTTTTTPVSALALHINPNPVVNTAPPVVEFDLPSDGTCSLVIYSTMGQRLASVDMGQLSKGKHTWQPGGFPMNLSLYPSGVYFARLFCNGQSTLTRFMVMR
jgi:1,4-alpha-glucan branching enzyme